MSFASLSSPFFPLKIVTRITKVILPIILPLVVLTVARSRIVLVTVGSRVEQLVQTDGTSGDDARFVPHQDLLFFPVFDVLFNSCLWLGV